MNTNDPLKFVNMEDWKHMQRSLKTKWPRSIAGYYILESQQNLELSGAGYGFKVYCPFGSYDYGMVALNEKHGFYEIVIQCGGDDTKNLEDALATTGVVKWDRNIIVPFAPLHVVEALRRACPRVRSSLAGVYDSNSFVMHKNAPLFPRERYPPEVSIDFLQVEHIEVVDSTWPHRYDTSRWYFEYLIKNGRGYGLFHRQRLVSWVFVNEAGTLGHMYTLKEHRRKAYAEMLLKYLCNVLLSFGQDVFAFSVKNNVGAERLYLKLGFEKFYDVAWCYIKPENNVQ